MARQEFYSGRRKRVNVLFILFALLIILIAVIVVLFYGMQKYTVITKDDVRIVLDEEQRNQTTQAAQTRRYENVDVKINFREPDYTNLKSNAGNGLEQMRAVFIPYDQINMPMVEASVSRLSTGNSIMIEMKPRGGYLAWTSEAALAVRNNINYPSDTTNNIQKYVDYIKEHDVWLVAQISCLLDNKMANNSTGLFLMTDAGLPYRDETGTWMDPYNPDVRQYVIDMIEELYAMGFDEVVLADVIHPTLPENTVIQYTVPMSTEPSPSKAISSFAVTIADHFKDRKEVLSIYVNSAYSLVKTDTATGQSAPLFFKIFDRVYYNTDKYTFSFNQQDISRTLSAEESAKRFVPVVINYLPNDPATVSWVLIDQEEKNN